MKPGNQVRQYDVRVSGEPRPAYIIQALNLPEAEALATRLCAKSGREVTVKELPETEI